MTLMLWTQVAPSILCITQITKMNTKSLLNSVTKCGQKSFLNLVASKASQKWTEIPYRILQNFRKKPWWILLTTFIWKKFFQKIFFKTLRIWKFLILFYFPFFRRSNLLEKKEFWSFFTLVNKRSAKVRTSQCNAPKKF